jgi:predicted DNA-binding protein YlxM (UPF0122 family)
MTNEEREVLKDKLSQYRGAVGEIADRAGVSRQMVYDVMRGFYPGDHVLDVASEVLLERKRRREESEARFKSVIAAL